MDKEKAFGALESAYDYRTVKHDAETAMALTTGGIIYDKSDHLNQWYVGICTSISLIQNRKKANGKDYSYDFQYLLQKKYADLNWDEGSSIFSALKVAKNFGLLPASLWTHTTVDDLKLPYSKYIAKLQAIPDAEIKRLLALCVDKIAGYASVDVNDQQMLARAINDSGVGILCRYEVGSEWYSPTNPLKAPQRIIGAHAIGMTYFNYVTNVDQKLANTWGDWNDDGNANVNWTTYQPTEAWIILKETPLIAQPTIKKGMNGEPAAMLQIYLNKNGANLVVDGGFGEKTRLALVAFQKSHNLSADGVCGKNTWQAFSMIEIITKVCTSKGVEPLLGVSVATCESGLNPLAKLFNKSSNSTDRGLYQWNSRYHSEISDADAFDPETACEYFCKAVLAGKLKSYWSASQPCWSKKLTAEIKSKYKL